MLNLVNFNGTDCEDDPMNRYLLPLLLLAALLPPLFPATAQPVTTHPRLWIRQQDLPRLQSWAVNTNPLWKQALLPALQQAIQTYDTKFFPGGVAAKPYPDRGEHDYELYCSEAYAEFFAFMSLMLTDQTAKDDCAQRARILLMYEMNEAVKGVAADSNGVQVPFRGRLFSNFNRANYWGEAFGLTVDWISPYLTKADKQTIRTVFLRWASEQYTAYPMMRWFPSLTGPGNDPALLGKNETEQYMLRWVANNYYAGHARNLTLMALSLDEADDPPLDAQQPVTKLGNTLRSYVTNITDNWLYQQYAMYEDSATVAKDYGYAARNISIGKAAGGLPVEGSMYGFSVGVVFQELLALYTSGLADSAKLGPQMKLLTSNYWDKHVDGFLHSITPVSHMPYDAINKYLGQVYEPACYGDILRYYVNFQTIEEMGPIALYDIATNNTERLAKCRWICRDAQQGGAAHFIQRASSVWSDVEVTYSLLYFLMFDPASFETSDPRPQLPTDFFQPPIGRVLSRSDWTKDASWITFLNPWMTINHINETAGQFEFYRKGEWLTKQWSGYGNVSMLTPEYFNTLNVKNDPVQYRQGFEDATDTLGGQWTNGQASGDPATRASFAEDYTFIEGNMTNLYNSRNAQDVKHVSRSLLWIKPDHLVIYDRAETNKFGRFKKFNCSVLNYPVLNGRTATVTSTTGQQLFIQSLLPDNGPMYETHNWTADPRKEYNAVAENEPSKYRLVIEDTAATTRFLTILQGADAGALQTPAEHFVSMDGAFEGSILGNIAVLFPHRLDNYSTVSYRIPPQVKGHYITGLFPGAGYDVKQIAIDSGDDIVVTLGGALLSDSAGVLHFGRTGITGIDEQPGREDVPDKLAVTMYPNPVSNRLTLTSTGVNALRDISIYNVLGEEKLRLSASEASVSIDCSQLQSGFYICRMGKGERLMLRTFFVVK
jgi:hypothetical protein